MEALLLVLESDIKIHIEWPEDMDDVGFCDQLFIDKYYPNLYNSYDDSLRWLRLVSISWNNVG